MSWQNAEIAKKIKKYDAHPMFTGHRDRPWSVARRTTEHRSKLVRDENGPLRFESDDEAWEWIEENLEEEDSK